MPRFQKKDTSGEAAAVGLLKEHLIGTFTVFLNQTQNHPDQRALDHTWVEELVVKIGSPGILNRAKHPISVVLQDGSWNEVLLNLMSEQGQGSFPTLPDGAQVLVFAGQHRLAMLSQLGLEPDELWWHALVYKRDLEVKHPAEFLTMMHESNSPHIVKTSSDVDLFRAVVKLKDLFKTGSISENSFLQNRRLLLSGSEERTSRAICNLTRNDSLMNAIAKALSRVHIARTFLPGSWMRLTTGRLYMVASGLVKEMTTQVDQLTKGMTEVPEEVMLRAQSCLVSKLEDHTGKGNKSKHPWERLPGGRKAALQRALARPTDFVTTLNPKGGDPWSMKDMVLLPSCFGSKIIEDELKLMQTVTNHVLKMILTEVNFEQYCKGNPETMESPTDHPEGLIAQFLHEKHPDDPNLQQYECKVLHQLWVNRATLHNELDTHKIPTVEVAGEEDYQRLVDKSKPWWHTLRLFKVSRLRSRFRLTVPKTFGPADNSDKDKVVSQGTPCSEGLGGRHSKRPADSSSTYDTQKRAKLSSGQNLEESQRSETNRDYRDDTSTRRSPVIPVGDSHTPKNPELGHLHTSEDKIDNGTDGRQAPVEDEEDIYGSDGDGSENEGVPTGIRQGGDRRLTNALEQLTGVANDMTRSESRAVRELLCQIIAGQKSGNMEYLVKGLVHKGKKILSKLEKLPEVRYTTPDSQTEVDEDVQGGGVEGEGCH